MKSYTWLFFFFIFIACSSKKENNEPANTQTAVEAPLPTPQGDSGIAQAEDNAIPLEKYYAWEIDYEAGTKHRNPELKGDSLSADSIIGWLNSTHPNVQLHKSGMNNDTIILEIPDSEYLTQRMGSTGPSEYLAKVVINLTAVAGINFVRLNFEEGDHASPGVWSKKEFRDIKTIQ